MGKILSYTKAQLMKSITIKLLVENPRSRLVYEEGRAIREHILKIFDPYLIKSDMWLHIMKFISQKNLPHQRKLARV